MSLLLQALIALPIASDTAAVDFSDEVLPILKARCVECHQDPAKNAGKRAKGGLRLDGKHWILQGTKSGPVIVAGAPLKSTLIELVALDDDDPDRMPPKGDKLTPTEIDTLSRWVAEGASFGDWVGAPTSPVKVTPSTKAPAGKLPRLIQALVNLGEGVAPVTESARAAAAGERGTIAPAFPGSPLLSVSFTSYQGRTGTRDVTGLTAIAENVATLDLGRTRINDAALEVVAKMTRLIKLDLRQTNITDKALKQLAGLQNLRSLNLFKVNITDESIGLLSGLKKLETVYLWQSKVSPAGAQQLRDRRPDLRVVYEAILPPPEQPSPDGDGDRRRRR
jgi:mono/diheme cytochrome c family protein